MATTRRRALAALSLAALACAAFALPGPGDAILVSVGPEGEAGVGASYEGTVSNSGRWVAFESDASNFAPDDGNDAYDVFLKDRSTGALFLLSQDGDGNEGDSWSYFPILSANGRKVLYYTAATNLKEGTDAQVLLYDHRTGETVEVSVGPGGEPGNGACDLYDFRGFSGNGRWAVFSSLATNLVEGDEAENNDVFLADLARGTIRRISTGHDGAEANGASWGPYISPNGRWIAFLSEATNIVPGDANGFADCFLYDVKKGTVRLVSRNTDGGQGNGSSGEGSPSVSNNGRTVAFCSAATNLDVLFADGNGSKDVFLADLAAGTVRRISDDFEGGPSNGNAGDTAMDAAGRIVTWWTYASDTLETDNNLDYEQVVHEVATGTNSRLLHHVEGGPSAGRSYGYGSGFSPNGKWFVVSAEGTDVVAGGTNGEFNVFLLPMR